MKYKPSAAASGAGFSDIPRLGRDTLCCAGILLAFGLLTALGSMAHPALGLALALLGTAALAAVFYRSYGRLRQNNMELDRACRTRLLEKYLGGDIPPEGDLTEAMPDLEGEYFAVADLQCIDFSGYLPECGEEHIPPMEYFQVDRWMRQYAAERMAGISVPYFVPMTDGMEILINVRGLDEGDLNASSRAKIGEICQALSLCVEDLRVHGLVCGAVVSTVYYGRENIVRAKKEADELTAYAELMGDSSTVKNGYDHAEVPMDLSDKLLRTELEKRFMQGISNRNFAQLKSTMDGFVDLELRTAARYPDLLKKHLLSHMEQLLSAFSISVVDYDPEEAVVVEQYRQLLALSSAQQLRDQCGVVIDALKDYAETGAREHSDKVEKALKFIEENYDDPGICADRIGDALGLSASYVSRLLRQNTGMGVVDYIHSFRLKKAKELLANTDRSVDDIAVAVGFSSRWTLTRSFKRYEETTPGAYREQYQKTAGV